MENVFDEFLVEASIRALNNKSKNIFSLGPFAYKCFCDDMKNYLILSEARGGLEVKSYTHPLGIVFVVEKDWSLGPNEMEVSIGVSRTDDFLSITPKGDVEYSVEEK